MDIPILEKNIQQNVPIMAIETYTGSQISNCNENIPIIRLSNAENLPIQNILSSGKNLNKLSVIVSVQEMCYIIDDSSGQPIYVRVLQPVEINETTTHSTIMASNSDADLTMKFKDNSDKQILTLTEDGNLEMAEIACWNDIQSSQSNIIFQ